MKLKFAASAVLLAMAFSCSAPEDYAGYVDTKIGSGGHGHVFVGASVPFGLVQLGPTSIPQQWDWCSGYHDSDSTVIGFSHTHLEGTGIGDLFDITVMPVTGSVEYSREGLWSYADRTREVAEPDYYSVPLLRYDILAEMTATSRVGFHRYTFPASDSTAIVFDLENGGCWDKATDTRIEADGNDALKGWRFSRGWARNQKVFFYAKFSKPFESVENIGQYARVNFDLAEGEKVMLKVAISPVDIDGAKANMAAELPGWDFEKTREAARNAWNRELSKIRIETGDVDERTIFYTALYHTMIQPSEFCDVNGDYRGADGDIHRNNDFKTYTTFSLWDTYRAAMPLMTVIHPEKIRDIARTMMKIHEEQGKLPVWHLWGNETDCMVGNPGVIALADILVKDFEGFDKEQAYNALRESEMRPDRGQDIRMECGFIPADMDFNESVAYDMEYAIADGAMAAAARRLGKEEDYAYFNERSHSYRNYFDPETLFIRGRNSDGTFVEPFNPYSSNHRADVYCEGNAWQYTWLVPQDFDGLVTLYGSKEKLAERLDSLFAAKNEIEGAEASPDISGLIGQYAHGNEPSHHIIYFYTMAGQPWKAADKIDEVLRTLYFHDPNGLSGNEDVGQMSAWYILSSLGMYQVEPAGARFWFGKPSFAGAEVQVPGGTLKIRAEGLSGEARYIQSVTLNGKNHPYPYIEFNDIVKGGELVFRMGTEKTLWY
ncbi:MAG: GH92 family glycosyl hydrolase [Candidatus Cryptobacteroides sp.]|nr:GH92 family glycosyl hydrolase [Bacteroidales bacterium]MDY5496161.1 GH92 family glycosyl hydrolase [Candidatus Cryptobacteroides sp.]